MRRRAVFGMVLLVVLVGGSAREAQACRRFSIWQYPYPQRCSVTRPQVSDHSWYVELVPLPPAKPFDWEGEPLWAAVANRIEPRF
jgi:hypothetical protein